MGYLPEPLSVIKWTLSVLAVSLGGAGVLLYKFQTSLIYPSNMPSGSRTVVFTPDEFDMETYEELTLITPDGVRIRAYLILYDDDGVQADDGKDEGEKESVKAEDRPTVLLLHANAGNVGHRLPIAKVFHNNMRCNILALSYRGYGKSEGSANETGLRLDAQTALDYILSHPRLERTKIVLYGQSIGGAVAIDLASRNSNRIAGLIIWDSAKLVPLFPPTLPVLYLSGAKDELVPPYMMTRLYDTSGGKKEYRSFEKGTHNDTCVQPGYFTTIANFISTIIGVPSTTASSSSLPRSSPHSDDGSYDLLDDEVDIARSGGAGSRIVELGDIAKEKIKEKLDEKL